MQLIYRGHSCTYTSAHAKPAHQSRAINWRYQLPGVAQREILPVKPSTTARFVQPRAINWRYQISTEV